MHYETVDHLDRDTSVRELLKPLDRFLSMENASEVVVNRPQEVFVEVGAEWHRFDVPELTMDTLLFLANAVASNTEQTIGPMNPILSAKLPGDQRAQFVVPPAVEHDRFSLNIRIPSRRIMSLEEFERAGLFSRFEWGRSRDFEKHESQLSHSDRHLAQLLRDGNLADFIRHAVRAGKNIAITGDTGSGKTTVMKSACQEIPSTERLVTIEDVRELFLPKHPNAVHLLYSKGGQGVAQVTPSDLISSCMRMKPNRVLLAELRGGEAFDFIKLLTTGHSGSITSFHAESPALAPERFVFMAKESPFASIFDAAALKRLFSMNVDVIIHVVAKNIYNDAGDPIRKERFVSEVRFDPVAKAANDSDFVGVKVARVGEVAA